MYRLNTGVIFIFQMYGFLCLFIVCSFWLFSFCCCSDPFYKQKYKKYLAKQVHLHLKEKLLERAKEQAQAICNKPLDKTWERLLLESDVAAATAAAEEAETSAKEANDAANKAAKEAKKTTTAEDAIHLTGNAAQALIIKAAEATAAAAAAARKAAAAARRAAPVADTTREGRAVAAAAEEAEEAANTAETAAAAARGAARGAPTAAAVTAGKSAAEAAKDAAEAAKKAKAEMEKYFNNAWDQISHPKFHETKPYNNVEPAEVD